MFDFNALYGGMQSRRLPTTPGVRWNRSGTTFTKAVMADGTSFAAVQWLAYLQATARYLKLATGEVVTMHHKYHQGEVKVRGDEVDGYCEVGGRVYIFEFNGCHWHGCKCQNAPNLEKRAIWERKRGRLEKIGTLIQIWECEWEEYKALNPQISEIDTLFPRIMRRSESEVDLVNAIRDGSFFGFVHCDLW